MTIAIATARKPSSAGTYFIGRSYTRRHIGANRRGCCGGFRWDERG
jgi:hypothetical protein